MQVFIDTLLDIRSGKILWDTEAGDVVRKLPAKPISFDPTTIEIRNIEVLLVMLHSAQTHYVERELQQCGYRVSICSHPFEALPLAVRTRPDLVIISAMMPELSGIDLAIALAAMPATRNISTAIITSLSADDEYLKFLPRQVPVIFKGPSFGDDLYRTLDRLFLI
ncbi:MAG: CheY-like receiver [Rhodospirillaceae bacterium]|nr:MAG: CheY-like receiver [Rhodospirillaceae bacterium]